jgi:hypothetical protein
MIKRQQLGPVPFPFRQKRKDTKTDEKPRSETAARLGVTRQAARQHYQRRHRDIATTRQRPK